MPDQDELLKALREAHKACLNAMQMLAEQEPVKPRWTHPTADKSVMMCGNCGIEIPLGKPRYCPWCGKKVKWDA